MISIKLNGGLGNMLFQIAALEEMGRRSGFQTSYPHLDNVIDTISRVYHSGNANEFLDIFKNFHWQDLDDCEVRNTVSVPYEFVSLDIADKTCYEGYFQSEKYFNREATLKLFEPADEINNKLPKRLKGVTSIHVRRGDFVNNPVTPVLSMDYYYKAMDLIGVSDFMIFSDDYKWCKERFREDNILFFDDIRESVNYIELFWMSRCENNIIANSSFSWWGTYLNQNPNKKVIAPKDWFLPKSGLKVKDVYCDNWILI